MGLLPIRDYPWPPTGSLGIILTCGIHPFAVVLVIDLFPKERRAAYASLNDVNRISMVSSNKCSLNSCQCGPASTEVTLLSVLIVNPFVRGPYAMV